MFACKIICISSRAFHVHIACVITNLHANEVGLGNVGSHVGKTRFLLEAIKLCLVLKTEAEKKKTEREGGGYLVIVVRIQSASINAACC